VPQRAHTIRSILLEVERLHSHLLNLGLSCHFVGFDTGFMQFFRVREKSMTMAELLIGSRKTYGLNLIGGVRRDILKEQRLQTLKLVREMRADVSELVEMLLATPNMEQRTQGIGILDRQIARDLRFDHPYADYGNIPKTLFTFTGGAGFSRPGGRGRSAHRSQADRQRAGQRGPMKRSKAGGLRDGKGHG